MPRYTIEDGLRWKAMYESGMTFEQVSLEDNRHPVVETVRKWSIRAGVITRPAYRPRSSRKPKPSQIKNPGSATVRQVMSPGGHRRHRRRGGI